MCRPRARHNPAGSVRARLVRTTTPGRDLVSKPQEEACHRSEADCADSPQRVLPPFRKRRFRMPSGMQNRPLTVQNAHWRGSFLRNHVTASAGSNRRPLPSTIPASNETYFFFNISFDKRQDFSMILHIISRLPRERRDLALPEGHRWRQSPSGCPGFSAGAKKSRAADIAIAGGSRRLGDRTGGLPGVPVTAIIAPDGVNKA